MDGASNITAIPNDGSPIPSPLIPPDVGSSNPPPLISPAIPDEGSIPNPLIPPVDKLKSLGDIMTFYINGQTIVIDPSNLGDVWKLRSAERGDVIEAVLAATEYKTWYNIGASGGGYFPVIDFQKGTNVISLKTLDPTLPSYAGDKATDKIIDYLQELDRKITVDGQLADKTLDVRIPEGTMDRIDLDMINREAERLKIKVKIKEF